MILGVEVQLITTRNENMRVLPQVTSRNAVLIGELSEKESLNLFSQIFYDTKSPKLSSKESKRISDFLVQLPRFPLDVAISAIYLRRTGMSFESYLNKVNDSYIEPEYLRIARENWDYCKTRYGIISSAFAQILVVNPYFMDLLLFVFLVDSQNIPYDLLDRLSGGRDCSADFINTLSRYSLVTLDNGSITMQRSTQTLGFQYILSRLEDKQKEASFSRVLKVICPNEQLCWPLYKGEPIELNDFLKVLPLHLNSALERVKNNSKLDRSLAKVMFTLANV